MNATRTLKKGTRVKLGAAEVELAADAEIAFPGAENERRFAAMLLESGERNFDINKRDLKLMYSRTTGAILPLEDQENLKPEDYRHLSIEERHYLGITPEMIEKIESDLTDEAKAEEIGREFDQIRQESRNAQAAAASDVDTFLKEGTIDVEKNAPVQTETAVERHLNETAPNQDPAEAAAADIENQPADQ